MEIVKKTDRLTMASESDEDLLVIMSFKEDAEACNTAFSEFHKRFKDFLYNILQGICSQHPNKNELVKVIFNNVFLNVYQYCESFSSEGEKDAAKIRKRIMGWLVSIARTEYKAQFTKSIKRNEEQLAYKAMLTASRVKPTYSYSEDIVRKAFDQIPKKRDRDILWTYWIFYEKGEKLQAKNLPDDVLKDLSARHNTTPENIRTIISRTNKIVKAFLETNYKK